MKQIVLLIFLSACGYAFSQQPYRFLQFDVSRGLSQNSVHCLFKDRDGLLWIGTQDGLNSFDGKNFKVYKPADGNDHSISDQFILSIQEDKDGFLWIGTRYGLNKMNKRTGHFTRYFMKEEEQHTFQSDYSQVFFSGKYGVITGKHGRLWHLVSDAFVPLGDSLSTLYFADSKDNIWLFNTDSGTKLGSLSSDRSRLVTSPHPLVKSDAPVSAQVHSERYSCFALSGSSYKLLVYDRLHCRWLEPVDMPGYVSSLVYDEGILYAGSRDGLYLVSNFKEVTRVDNTKPGSSGLPPGTILSIYADPDHNLWLGSASSGFFLYNKAFSNFRLLDIGGDQNGVNTITEDPDFTWIGSANGIYRLDPLTQNTTAFHILEGKKISALCTDHSGHIWAGVGHEGLWEISREGRVLKVYNTGNAPLHSNFILNLDCDPQGRLAVASDVNFYSFDTRSRTWTILTGNAETDARYVLHSYRDKEHNTWISTNLGLIRFDKEMRKTLSVPSVTDSDPIKRTLITSVTQDHEGLLWVSSISHGIYTLNNGNYRHFSAAEGLNSDVVYRLVCDNSNRIWATTSDGLYVLNRKKMQFVKLTVFDGMPVSSFPISGLFKSSKGHIYIGTSSGLIVFDPARVVFNEQAVEAKINDVKLNGISVASLGSGIGLIPDHNTLTLEFGTRNAFHLNTVIYQYRLSGADEKWVTLPAGSDKAVFANLPYGKLVLQVRAANSLSALESAPVSSFSITSKAPFYKTYWFAASCLVLASLLIFVSVQYYNRRRYRKQLEALRLQRELQFERLRISRDLHDNLGAELTYITSAIDNKAYTTTDLREKTDLELISNSSRQVMGQLRETIWAIKTEEIHLADFLHKLENNLLKYRQSLDQQIIVERRGDNIVLRPALVLALYRVCQEAVNNAVKYAGGSRIDIVAEGRGDLVLFTISDNGKGFDMNRVERGNGLYNMNDRVREAGGEFRVQSVPGQGTEIKISVKL